MRGARADVLARVDRRGVFAIHRALVPYAHTLDDPADRVRERGPWVVTHIPTGMAFAGPAFRLSLRQARDIVAYMHSECCVEALSSKSLASDPDVVLARAQAIEVQL